MSTNGKIILPTKYYLDYFRYVLKHVQQLYPHMLGPQQAFLDTFYQLSEEAQCLYLRINGRRGRYFRLSKFHYEEITDQANAVAQLQRVGFVRDLCEDDLPEDVLRPFTKDELWELIKRYTGTPISKSIARPALLEVACSIYTIDIIQAYDPITVQERMEDVEMIKLMFFGHPYGDLSEFVARDVGHLKIENRDGAEFSPFFQSREELDAYWKIYNSYKEWKLLVEMETPDEVLALWYEGLKDFLSEWAARTPSVSYKFCFKVGRYFESVGRLESAIEAYQLSEIPEAYKRRLMLLAKLKRTEEARQFAEWLLEHGKNAQLRILGQDFLAKQLTKNLASSTTRRIKLARMIEVTYQQGESIEQLVLEHLQQQGYYGFFSENYVWRSIFGLFYWEEITSLEYNVIHHPLQRLPSDIYSGFYTNREKALLTKWETIRTMEELKAFLQRQWENYQGSINPYVHWHGQLYPSIEAFLQWLDVAQIKSVLHTMAKNPRENATGFPDLFVHNGNSYSFYEVKSPNDHLSAQQLFWLDFFGKEGITVDILRTL